MTTPDLLQDSREVIDFGDLFEFCPEMLAILTSEGEFCRVSVAAVQAVGHPSMDLIGRSFFDFVHPDDLPVAGKEFERAVQTADRVSFRSRWRASNGRYHWIQWSLRRPHNVAHVYAVARDVTDHSAAERELARANEILSTVLISAPLPIWASDPDGRIQFWNESAERILGWTSEEVMRGIPPDPLPRYRGDEESLLSGEKRSWRRKDGSSRELRFWAAPLHENGTACGTLGMAVDVTEHDAQLYDALQQAYNDLRNTREAVMQHERLRVLGQMASGIAHDINNALAPVKLYTQVLLESEDGLSERGRGNLKTIRKAIDDVAETVARVREFYRPGESQPELLPMNLNDLVGDVLDLTRARWKDMPQKAGITIKVATELAEDLLPALGIESEIREAVINLIFNAIDAMPSGGTMTLRTGLIQTEPGFLHETGTGQAFIEVTDTGSGMDESTRRRCLEPFFTTKGERGTGLGLAMVYGIVQRNDGAIEIESAPGNGTTVRLRFALALSGVEKLRTAVKADVRAQLRVLVIDDDPLVAEVLRDILERDGHQVTVAEGGEEGVSIFRKAQAGGNGFGIVLTDLGMPNIDGRRVATAIKADSASTPVILLTGWGRRLLADGDIPPGVDQVLSKPADLNDLRNAINRCFAA